MKNDFKNFLFLLLLLSAPRLGQAQNGLIESAQDGAQKVTTRVQNKVEDFALSYLLTQRCAFYDGDRVFVNPACSRAAASLVNTLDCEGPTYSLCFVNDLRNLLKSDETADYLRGIVQGINEAFRTQGTFSLWRHTFFHYGQNRHEALRHLAVLFQDRNPAIVLKKLRQLDGKSFSVPKYAKLYSYTVGLIDANARQSRYLQLLPIRDWIEEPNDFFHFYVPAYLAVRIWSENTGDRAMAFFVPTVFNCLYEYRYLPSNLKNPIGGFIHGDPETLSIQRDSHILRECYLGYAGSRWAVDSPRTIMGHEDFFKEFSAGPEKFFRRLRDEE